MMGPGLFTTTFAAFTTVGWMGRHGAHLPGAPFLLSALLVLVGLAVAWVVGRPRPDDLAAASSVPVDSGVPSGAIVPETAESAPAGFTSDVS